MNRLNPYGEIGYADYSWNPLVGCSNASCPIRKVCWARRFARMIGEQKRRPCPLCAEFTPHLHPERLKAPATVKRTVVIATCFMSDVCDPAHSRADVERVFDTILNLAPQHIYLLLTKRPCLLPADDLWRARGRLWLGVSISTEKMWNEEYLKTVAEWFWQYEDLLHWISFEPVPANITPEALYEFLPTLPKRGLLVFGAQTKPWQCDVSPLTFQALADVAEESGWDIYFKNNLTLRRRKYRFLREYNRLPWREE